MDHWIRTHRNSIPMDQWQTNFRVWGQSSSIFNLYSWTALQDRQPQSCYDQIQCLLQVQHSRASHHQLCVHTDCNARRFSLCRQTYLPSYDRKLTFYEHQSGSRRIKQNYGSQKALWRTYGNKCRHQSNLLYMPLRLWVRQSFNFATRLRPLLSRLMHLKLALEQGDMSLL